MIESALLLFLVIDPFGNLPFVLAVLDNLGARDYRRTILREMSLALLVLLVFALAGDQLLGYLNIERASLSVAGGVILFLISLKMIFRSAAEIFDDRYDNDPFLVPIAVPSLAGPSAITTVMILRTQPQVGLLSLLGALLIVFVAAGALFLIGRRISTFLGQRGIKAMEKFMGLLLSLVSVNMILMGVKDFLSL
jgi:multiple antibiotic resistance protein